MIKGKNVGLRAVERIDLPLLRDWRNLDDFRKNFREIRELNLDNQEQWFEHSCVGNPNDFMFVIEDLTSGDAIGAAGLLYINWVIRSADISFYIGKNKEYVSEEGFALDAAKLLVDYGFQRLNLNKIWMELYEFDRKKQNFFMEKLGFKQDGILRENCFEDGRYWDSIIISLLKNEYSK
jgi:RimJ/RimL family protein N-acetyltransferase